MAERLKLYSYFRSSCSWRVRIALEWKQLDYETLAINLLKGEQNSDDYKRVNPLAQVPALLLPSKELLTQSVSILEYLEEVYPQRPLFPQDAVQRARVRQIVEIIASGIQPLQNPSTLMKIASEQEKRTEFAALWIRKGFDALEELLGQTSGEYCVGDQVSMADICLVPQVTNAGRYNVSLENYPLIRRINDSLSELREFQRSHPSVQPDVVRNETPELKK